MNAWKKRHPVWVRDMDMGSYFEVFLISAVGSVLGIRLFLELTGYPKVGGDTLHIAHMLWGGLFMAAAFIVLFAFLNRSSYFLGAFIGGVGFGTFIDEIGKFVTRDNDYFYRPAEALIYLVFILLFVAFRTLRRTGYTSREYLMNTVKELEEVVVHDLDPVDKKRALSYLSRSDPGHPLVSRLHAILDSADLVPRSRPSLWVRVRSRLSGFYDRITAKPLFRTGLILFFIGQLVVKLIYVTFLVFLYGLGWERLPDSRMLGQLANRVEHLGFLSGMQLGSSLIAGVFVFLGVFRLRRSRIRAFRMFERSILVSLLLTQVFVFYEKQFAALAGLFFNVAVLLALRAMIREEETRESVTERQQGGSHD